MCLSLSVTRILHALVSIMDPLTSALSPAEIALISSLLLCISAGRLVTDCIHCGSTVALTICVSDDNGNMGKQMARISPPVQICLTLFQCALLAPTLRIFSLVSPTSIKTAPYGTSSTTKKLANTSEFTTICICQHTHVLATSEFTTTCILQHTRTLATSFNTAPRQATTETG